MSTSLKRQPSGDADDSPDPKRTSTENTKLLATSPESKPPNDPQTTPIRPAAEKAEEEPEQTSPETVSFLQPPTKVGGFSITDKVRIADDKVATNGKSDSIINSGFNLSDVALFSNGDTSHSSDGTNIFAAALANVTGGGGIFGSASSSAGEAFVFGANLSDRVMAPKSDTEKSDTETSDEKGSGSNTEEVSAENAKHTFVESKVTSGEEDEKRLIQTSCKLYQFCADQKIWLDRGAGVLRLNEMIVADRSTSRLVVRSKAVMKVLLNTKIFSDMFINRANLTTIRLSALDNGRMGTYLVKCTRNECDRIHTMLLKRREIERQNEEEHGGESSKLSKSKEKADETSKEETANSENPVQDENLDNLGPVDENLDNSSPPEDKIDNDQEEGVKESNDENEDSEEADVPEVEKVNSDEVDPEIVSTEGKCKSQDVVPKSNILEVESVGNGNSEELLKSEETVSQAGKDEGDQKTPQVS